MPRVVADVAVADFLTALGVKLEEVPAPLHAAFARGKSVEMMVHVDQDEIDDEATPPDIAYPDAIQLDATDFREALRALLEGDLTIAGVLFARALQGDDEASTVAEEEIRRAVVERRKPQQLAVAA